MPRFSSSLASAQTWVEPTSLPDYLDASQVAGNVSLEHKRLCLNTLGAYGLGGQDSFAYSAGAQIRITELNYKTEGERVEVVAVSEVNVCKAMLNGAGTVHGGCICYLIDNCGSAPLVVLGLMRGVNGVGVSQALSIFFHAPASIDTCMRITSTSIALGTRILSSRCEIRDKESGRPIASAILTKMQPTSAPPPARL